MLRKSRSEREMLQRLLLFPSSPMITGCPCVLSSPRRWKDTRLCCRDRDPPPRRPSTFICSAPGSRMFGAAFAILRYCIGKSISITGGGGESISPSEAGRSVGGRRWSLRPSGGCPASRLPRHRREGGVKFTRREIKKNV